MGLWGGQWIAVNYMASEGAPPYKRNGMGAAVLAGAAGGKEFVFLYGGVKGDEGITIIIIAISCS